MNDIQRYELALWLNLVVITISLLIIIFVNDVDIAKQKPLYAICTVLGVYGAIKSAKKLDEAHREDYETYYKVLKEMGEENGQESTTNIKSE